MNSSGMIWSAIEEVTVNALQLHRYTIVIMVGRIAECGGIDLQILDIGTDGHIAFNEPTSSLSWHTRLKTLSKHPIEHNARFFEGREGLLVNVITMRVGTILNARMLVLVASGKTNARLI